MLNREIQLRILFVDEGTDVQSAEEKLPKGRWEVSNQAAWPTTAVSCTQHRLFVL